MLISFAQTLIANIGGKTVPGQFFFNHIILLQGLIFKTTHNLNKSKDESLAGCGAEPREKICRLRIHSSAATSALIFA